MAYNTNLYLWPSTLYNRCGHKGTGRAGRSSIQVRVINKRSRQRCGLCYLGSNRGLSTDKWWSGPWHHGECTCWHVLPRGRGWSFWRLWGWGWRHRRFHWGEWRKVVCSYVIQQFCYQHEVIVQWYYGFFHHSSFWPTVFKSAPSPKIFFAAKINLCTYSKHIVSFTFLFF